MTTDAGLEGATNGSTFELSIDELAREARVSTDFVERLVHAGALQPLNGRHEVGDLPRVRLAAALSAGGVDLDGLLWAIRGGHLRLDFISRVWNVAEPSGGTFGDLAAAVRERGHELAALYAAFGLATPPPETVLRGDDKAVILAFVDLWHLVDERPEAAIRAAHIAGDGVRRIQEATLDLFDEFEGSPPQRVRRGLSYEEAMQPSAGIDGMMARLLPWLQGRHSEHEVFGRIVSFVERAYRAEVHQEGPVHARAIAFVDLTGYTEFTAASGDERAAHLAAMLHGLAQSAVGEGRGRVVKLLGDGVMMRFESMLDGVRSTLALMADISRAGLPPAHAGIASGPFIARDGDLFGHTVNLASRIATYASSGELLIPREHARLLDPDEFTWQDAGVAALKGVPDPVSLIRVVLGKR